MLYDRRVGPLRFLREKAPGGGERKEKEARRTGVLICGAFAGKADER